MKHIRQSVLVENTLHELFCKRQKASPTRIIAYLGYHFVGMDFAMQTLKNLRQQKIITRLYIDEEVFRYYKKKEIIQLTEIDDWVTIQELEKLEDFDYLFLTTFPISLVTNLIALNDEHRFVRFLIKSLFSKKIVSALSVSLNSNHPVWKDNEFTYGTSFLKTKLNQHLQQLQSMGVHLLEFDEVGSFFSQKMIAKKQVVTAKEIESLLSNHETELIIDQQTIITPLAIDILKQHQINLIRK